MTVFRLIHRNDDDDDDDDDNNNDDNENDDDNDDDGVDNDNDDLYLEFCSPAETNWLKNVEWTGFRQKHFGAVWK